MSRRRKFEHLFVKYAGYDVQEQKSKISLNCVDTATYLFFHELDKICHEFDYVKSVALSYNTCNIYLPPYLAYRSDINNNIVINLVWSVFDRSFTEFSVIFVIRQGLVTNFCNPVEYKGFYSMFEGKVITNLEISQSHSKQLIKNILERLRPTDFNIFASSPRDYLIRPMELLLRENIRFCKHVL